MMNEEKKRTLLIRKTQHSDLLPVAHNMRPEDVLEIWTSHRTQPFDALQMGYENSNACFTLVLNDKPVAIYGAVIDPSEKRLSCIWLLGTPEIEDVWFYFSKQSREVIKMLKAMYGRLYNRVDARNKKSIAWLTWCGAKIFPAEPFGPDKMPFHYFIIQ